MDKIDEINLHVEGQIFKVKKQLLCQHSDYFLAMFSGNFVEMDQKDINIDMVDANVMKIILDYMNTSRIDLFSHPLSVVETLANTGDFLQVTDLIKYIENSLNSRLSLSNWMEIMAIAERLSYFKIQNSAAAFGLLSFKQMLPKYIPSIDKLFWYLSHPYLEHENELQVFKFGFDWIIQTKTHFDALFIILGCLDIKKITKEDLEEMVLLLGDDHKNSTIEKVLNCLKWLLNENVISSNMIYSKKPAICEIFTERVYNEIIILIKENKQRKYITRTPVMPMKIIKNNNDYAASRLEYRSNFMYKFNEEDGFTKWLELAEETQKVWYVSSWGPTKVVVVYGEGKWTNILSNGNVKIYDTLREEWIKHSTKLPLYSNAGTHVVDDLLFIIGGVNECGETKASGIVYNLKERTYGKIAKLPDPIQSPAMCSHKGKIYLSGVKHCYRYESDLLHGRWIKMIDTDFLANRLVSFKDYIYMTASDFQYRSLYRFKPDVPNATLESIHALPVTALFSFSDHLLLFSRQYSITTEDTVKVQKIYVDNETEEIWSEAVPGNLTDIILAGCSTLVLSLPPLDNTISKYRQNYISRFSNIVVYA